MSQSTVVVLGSCNVDFTTYVPRLPAAGETLLGTEFVTTYGGKGANQSMAACKLGAVVSFIAKVGDDEWGVKYKCYLSTAGVDTTHVSVCRGISTGVAQICVSGDGENHIVVVPGANARLSGADVEAATALLQSAAVVVAQLETPVDTALRAFQLARGVRILNAAPAPTNDLRELLTLCSLLCVNQLEAAQLTGKRADYELGETMRSLLRTGCESVVVTLGAAGAALATRADPEPAFVPAERVVAVDTTGAGDAFVGALAAQLATGVALRKAVEAACRVAARSVTAKGTHASYPSDFQSVDVTGTCLHKPSITETS